MTLDLCGNTDTDDGDARLKHGNDVIEIVDLVTSFAWRIDDEKFSSVITWWHPRVQTIQICKILWFCSLLLLLLP